jgi:NAD(P) transhydrogenase subunit alpha
MLIGIPRESAPGERRVAAVPESVARFPAQLLVESEAGLGSYHTDAEYEAAGALIGDPWGCEVVAKVAPPADEEVDRLQAGGILVGFLQPADRPELLERLAAHKVTALAMEAIPRITRAQSMDALSSQATVGGYLGTLLAASHLPRFFPNLTTAAGSIPPAKVLVIGAGVAGLQAIATARRLGAQVTAYDTRAAVKDQIHSLGARFLELDLGADETEGTGGYARVLDQSALSRQQESLAGPIADADVVIATAAVPGAPAPVLITADAVAGMKRGSVIVDLAAERGGNCELTRPGEEVVDHGVTVLGPLNLSSRLPVHSSAMYARNVAALIGELVQGDRPHIDLEDAVIGPACVVHDGAVRFGRG